MARVTKLNDSFICMAGLKDRPHARTTILGILNGWTDERIQKATSGSPSIVRNRARRLVEEWGLNDHRTSIVHGAVNGGIQIKITEDDLYFFNWLTDQESRVLDVFARGNTYRQVSDIIGIDESKVGKLIREVSHWPGRSGYVQAALSFRAVQISKELFDAPHSDVVFG